MKSASKEIVERLAGVAEYRDTDTGKHIKRIVSYSQRISVVLNMPAEFVEEITFASLLHDIGKVGVSDNILLKRGPLTPEEFDLMKTHTVIGEKMLAGSSYPGMAMAASVALNHHERWDGRGYSRGLKGEKIPNHFRSMTALSPLQFQKQLRLREARRLMLTEHLDAATAAFQVGYESPSQFSREYNRIFGAPPLRDIANLRQMAAQ